MINLIENVVKTSIEDCQFLVLSRNIQKRVDVMAQKETTQLRTMSEVLKVHIYLSDGHIPSNNKVSCPQKPNGDGPTSVFQFRPETLKKWSMLWRRKKPPSLEQCQRSRKFTSNCWVAPFRGISIFLAEKNQTTMSRLDFLVPSRNVEKLKY